MLSLGPFERVLVELGRRRGVSAFRHTVKFGIGLTRDILRAPPEALRLYRSDLLVVDHALPGGNALAERLRVSFVNVAGALAFHPDPDIPPNTTNWGPARTPRERLRHLHAVGREALARFPVGAAIDPGSIREIADREGLRHDNVQRARQFARCYSERELDELCRLRTPGGMPLGWEHVRRLVSLPNRAKRLALQRRAAREGWTAARLSEVILREVGRKRQYGGRPFTVPWTLEEGVNQVVARSEQWLRRCRESWSGEADWLAAGAGGPEGSAGQGSVAARLEEASRVLLELGRAALELEAWLGKVTIAESERGGESEPAGGPAARGGRRGGRSAPADADRARHEPP